MAHDAALDLLELATGRLRQSRLRRPEKVRQAHQLRRQLGSRDDVDIRITGMWCDPLMPHLHDPFTHTYAYFDTCFVRVSQAVCNLSMALHRYVERPDDRARPGPQRHRPAWHRARLHGYKNMFADEARMQAWARSNRGDDSVRSPLRQAK